MSSEKKTLLFMYVDNYYGFVSESFNFDIKRRFRFDRKKNTIRSCPETTEALLGDFFGEKISALTLLIGDNGAGKTTLIRLMAKWLCELASGNYPQERGVFVIRAGECNKLIGFQDGGSWEINIGKRTVLETVTCKEMQSILRDISLLYYTDTMSDLELEELLTEDQSKFLRDYSLVARLSGALITDFPQNAKDTIRRTQFTFQMEQFLKLSCKKGFPTHLKKGFPIHFMKFSSVKIGTSKCLKHLKQLGQEGTDLILTLKDFGRTFAPKDNSPRMFTRCLLWGFVTGVASSILLWEARLFGNHPSRFIEVFHCAFSRYAAFVDRNAAASEVYTAIMDFIRNVYDCVFACREVNFRNEFDTQWGQKFKDTAIKYTEFLKEAEERYASQSGEFHWENRFARDKIVYYISLDELPLERWRTFWMLYKEIDHIMPDCNFDWQYASSGEKNLTNFMVPMDWTIGDDFRREKKHLWLFLDEPDNTLHPQQKRNFLKYISDTYNQTDTRYDNCQLWISTHSPIMLSDVPKQAVILISEENNKRMQTQIPRSPFAQQIYTLFNDAFFMRKGIIGALAEKKINDVYKELSALESALIHCEGNDPNEAKTQLLNAKSIIDCLDEPLLRGYILLIYKRCLAEINNHT